MIGTYCPKLAFITRKTTGVFHTSKKRFYSGTMTSKFRQYWEETTTGLPFSLAQKWHELIVTKYGESQRYYHTLIHIDEMKTWRDRFQHKLHKIKLVDYAIIFHDIIYDPQKGNNEEKSSEFFGEFGQEASLLPDDINTVKGWINLTKSHTTPEHTTEEGGQQDIHYLLDFDMAILGSKPRDYRRYKHQIWEEYCYLGYKTYCERRAEVLKKFLEVPYIYATKEFRDSHEEKARLNVTQEIADLSRVLDATQP